MTYNPVYAGKMITKADKGLILLHGRGGTANDILNLAPLLVDDSFFIVALNAPENSWYPYNFLQENNEPKLTESLDAVKKLIEDTANHIPLPKLYIAGFSQGACLALEVSARDAKKYGGIIAFSGGFIGKTLDPTKYKGDFQKTPVFLGCSDNDPHIPEFRLKESQEQLQALNALCTLTIYPGMGHIVSQEEIAFVKKTILKSVPS